MSKITITEQQHKDYEEQANVLAFVIGQCLAGGRNGVFKQKELFDYITTNIDFANLYSEVIVEYGIMGFDDEVDQAIMEEDNV